MRRIALAATGLIFSLFGMLVVPVMSIAVVAGCAPGFVWRKLRGKDKPRAALWPNCSGGECRMSHDQCDAERRRHG